VKKRNIEKEMVGVIKNDIKRAGVSVEDARKRVD